jgi:hypothetical protein
MRVTGASTGGAQPAFRIEQEHARRDDLFARAEAFANLDTVGQPGAERDRPRLEAIAGRHEHMLL